MKRKAVFPEKMTLIFIKHAYCRITTEPFFTKGWIEPTPKGFSSITFEKGRLETPNFA